MSISLFLFDSLQKYWHVCEACLARLFHSGLKPELTAFPVQVVEQFFDRPHCAAQLAPDLSQDGSSGCVAVLVAVVPELSTKVAPNLPECQQADNFAHSLSPNVQALPIWLDQQPLV